MTDAYNDWQKSRYFSERKMAELYDGRPSGSPSTVPSAERELELRLIARKAIDASLELADELEAA